MAASDREAMFAPEFGGPGLTQWSGSAAPDDQGQDAPFADDEAPAIVLRSLSPADIVALWRTDGPLLRVPTGIRSLDELCRGGLPVPWRVVIIGAPSAGKTFVETVIADALARGAHAAGMCVGLLAVDEEPEDVTVRLGQIAGFTVAELERRDPDTLDQLEEELAKLDVTLYDASWTIEGAAADLAGRARSQGKRAAFFVDSLHAATSDRSRGVEGGQPRLSVAANMQAIRAVCSEHRMLVVTTCEANRAAYASEQASSDRNDLAAGAESRSIEFLGQTLLVLRTPKDHPDVVEVSVPKNRRATARHIFHLRLDRERHRVEECGDPAEEAGASEEREAKSTEKNRASLEASARKVLKLIRRQPGMGQRQLRAAIDVAGLRIGVPRLESILCLLADTGRAENRPEKRGKREDAHWYALDEAAE